MSWSSRIVAVRGPSLPTTAVPPSVEQLPPAAAGDLAALRHDVPCTIVLIDGQFEQRPSPWHKELLDLLARGFRVIGAASMGALRAAELAPYGMTGTGRVFEAYASGRLVADDEVAVLHGPREFDWVPFTEAMVDVRATLCAALSARILALSDARALRATALALNFRDRTWSNIIDRSRPTQTPADRLEAFADWLPGGRRSIKREDAIASLTLAMKHREVPAIPQRPPPQTSLLHALLAHADARIIQPKPAASIS